MSDDPKKDEMSSNNNSTAEASGAEGMDDKKSIQDEKKDIEGLKETLPYPKQIIFIIGNEFCERFSYYGMRTILSLYLNEVLEFSETTASVLFHAFVACCYFTPIFGAILADSFLGKFRTIFYISIVYAIGQVVLTIGAAGFELNLAIAISFIGLGLIALGTGGIKPCVVSFGAEQFVLPEQENYMKSYFSFFYASINAGSLISTILTPLLRESGDGCAGQEKCYPAAFGVPAGLMFVAIILFLGGRVTNMYKMILPKENILVKTTQCIWYSFGQWRKNRKNTGSDNDMLDHGADKYGKSFIADVKAVLNVMYMFLPFPVFWALFDQQGSRWTFQARHMNGETLGFIILPDQMQVANPVLILAFIPLFEYIVYPLLSKCGLLKKPLQRIVTGGLLAGVAFYVSGALEMVMQEHYPDLPTAGNFHLTVYNGLPQGCVLGKVQLNYSPSDTDDTAGPFEFDFTDKQWFKEMNVPIEGNYSIDKFTAQCTEYNTEFADFKFVPIVPESEDDVAAMHLLIISELSAPKEGIIKAGNHLDPFDKTSDGRPAIKLIWNANVNQMINFTIKSDDETIEKSSTEPFGDLELIELEYINEHQLFVSIDGGAQFKIADEKLLFGGNYQFVYIQDGPDYTTENNKAKIHEITEKNVYHIFWILPQYLIITAGEVMFSITGLTFAFTQAPESMRAVLAAAFTVTTGFGNLIDVILLSTLEGVFTTQAHEFFLFASLMVVDMALLAWMATRYKYVNYTSAEKSS